MPVTETFAEFLTRKVRWFVVMSWLLILPAAYRAFAVSMVAGAWIARNSTHQDALHETIKIYLAWLYLCSVSLSRQLHLS